MRGRRASMPLGVVCEKAEDGGERQFSALRGACRVAPRTKWNCSRTMILAVCNRVKWLDRRSADWEIGDTASLETCATGRVSSCALYKMELLPDHDIGRLQTELNG